jgi:hypothetical protein
MVYFYHFLVLGLISIRRCMIQCERQIFGGTFDPSIAKVLRVRGYAMKQNGKLESIPIAPRLYPALPGYAKSHCIVIMRLFHVVWRFFKSNVELADLICVLT